MIHIVYPYRNRDLKRIRFSLNSLAVQTNTNFQVHFVDYGSDKNHAQEVQLLVPSYAFASYRYIYCAKTMWNKSHALNIVLQDLREGQFFVADVDGIFHPDLVQTLHEVASPDKVTYFQVGFLSKDTSEQERAFNAYSIKFLSTYEATGLSLFPVKVLKQIQGFNEYYHLWGSEDTDVHLRCQFQGLEVSFYEEAVLILHQWHTPYRALNDKKLTHNITIRNISRHNMNYLNALKQSGKITANEGFAWGKDISKAMQARFERTPDIIINLHHSKKERQKQLASLVDYNNQTVQLKWSSKNKVISLLKSAFSNIQWEKQISDTVLQFHIDNLRDRPYKYGVNPNKRLFTYTVQL